MEKIWLKNYDDGVPHEIELPQKTIPQLFQKTVEKFPRHTLLRFMLAGYTYGEVDKLSNRFAHMLKGLGMKKGGRVALNLPNCPQFVIAYIGALKAGCTVIPCNPLYTERELLHQLNDCEAEIMVTMSRFYPKVRKLKDRSKLKTIISTNIKDYFPGFIKFFYTLFKDKKEGDRVPVQDGDHQWVNILPQYPDKPVPDPGVDVEDPACFLYTGGTTGLSKGAMLSHRNLATNAIQIFNWMPDAKEGQEIGLALIPFFHSFGMSTCLNLSLILCGTLVLIPHFDLQMVLRAIAREKPTLFPAVPTIYIAIINAPNLEKYDLSSLKICISGAAPLPEEVHRKFTELTGSRLGEGFGLTETSPVTHCNPVYGKQKIGSVGLPFPNTEAKIVNMDDPSIDMPVGEEGELVIKGPQVMSGYLNRPEENKETFYDGWLLTGDIAKMDEDGFFYIVDRQKDMIIAGGLNIYPREIEEVLYAHHKVKEACVVGIPHEYRGETVKAYVVPRDGETLTEAEIKEFCQENLVKYKVPKIFEFRDELPVSLVGKVLRRVLLEEEQAKQKKDQEISG